MKKFFSLVLALIMALSLCVPVWGADPVEVSDEAGLVAAFENGGTYKLTKSVTVAENTRFVVGKGVSVTLDLGGNTLSSTNTETKTHNFFIDVNGGTLTISNGAVEYTHTGTNMGWNGATEVFDVTAGGVLNMNGVASKISGTDMNFAVHMNNWGFVTFNAENCVFDATYCGVRVFNSGPDMNDVTIKNSTLKGGSRAFWVHNYASSDMGGKLWSSSKETYDESKVLARLDLDIYNNNNTFEITGTAKSPIRYGFNESVYFTEQGVRVTDVAVEEPTVTPSDKLDDTEQDLVKDVDASVDDAAKETLSAAASAVADENPVSAEDVAAALTAKGIAADVEEFNIVVKPSYDVKITDVAADNTDVTSITLEITPVYQMVATNGTDVVVLDEGELTITEPVTITVKIPDTLAEQANGKLYVTHKNTYVYEATVAGTTGNYTATFTTTHGFSPFVFSLSPTTVAVVNGVEYASLQAAVDATAAGGTVKLEKDSAENITVGKNVTIDPNGKTYTGTVTASANYDVIKTAGKYVVATKIPSGSGSETTLKDKDGYDIYAVGGTTSVKATKADITKKVTGNAIASDGTVTYTATTYADGVNVYVEVDASVADYKLLKGNTIVAYLVNLSSVGDIPATTKTVSSYIKSAAEPKCSEYSKTLYPAGVYMIDGKAYAADAGNNWALLNGKFVNYGGVANAVPHTYTANTYSTVDRSVTTLKCTACKQVFTVLTPAQVKTMAPASYAKVNVAGTNYFIAVAAPVVGTTGGTVTSAPTFDAGIAMYVGMSVLAATGSAVVIGKKKD